MAFTEAAYDSKTVKTSTVYECPLKASSLSRQYIWMNCMIQDTLSSFFNVVPFSEESSFSNAFYGLYFNNHYIVIRYYSV